MSTSATVYMLIGVGYVTSLVMRFILWLDGR